MRLLHPRYFISTLLLLISSHVFCGDAAEIIGPFGCLDNSHASVTLPNSTAQDLLNVDIQPQGKSVKKRRGYGTAFTLSNATSPVHGVYLFYDSNGSDVSLSFNGPNMNVSVGGATPTVFYSTGPSGATYQCVDSLAFAYCANTSRSPIVKVNSSTYTLITTVNSTGTILAVTPERLVMAGFSEAPSRIDFSKPNDFATWTVGATNATGLQITITSPGSKITHLAYAHGRLYWFKDNSFGYVTIGATDANAVAGTGWQVVTINNSIGTLYNTSIFRDDILYFQGNDGHFYSFDGTNLVKLSTNIQATIDVTQGRSANAWTQTALADFQAGLTNPQGFISSSIVSGQLMGSSWTITETSSTTFNQGTLSNVSVVGNSVKLSTVNHNYGDTTNGWSFESVSGGAINPLGGSFWTANQDITAGSHGWQGFANGDSSPSGDNCTVTGRTGTKFVGYFRNTGTWSLTYTVNWGTGSISLTSINYADNSCSWQVKSIPAEFLAPGLNARVEIVDPSNPTDYIYSNYFVLSGSSISIYYASDVKGATTRRIYFDDLIGGYSVSTGTYTSQSYDSGLTTNTVSISSIGATINNYTPKLTLQTSNNNSTWRELGAGITPSSGTSYVGNRYYRYVASFTVTDSSAAFTTLDDVTLVARASGTWQSQIKNAPSLSSWDNFSSVTSGDGTHTFYIRSSTGVFYASATVPSWTSVGNGAVPSISTNPYFQIRDDFSITAATQNPVLESFTQNWFEGAASDKTYATYHDNANWFAVASGTGASANNKILRYDLLNQGWTIYDIPMAGMYVKNQSLYFGSVSSGKIFKFGDVDADNGSAIQAYWKSKDFFGSNPMLDKDYTTLSVFAGSVANSTMTVTYTISGTSSTVITMPLYDPNKAFKRFNKNLPLRTGNTINVQFGNNAIDQPFEVYGIQIGTVEKPWKPE